MEESFSFKFYLNKPKSKGKNLKIYGRLIVDRKKAELYSGFQTPEDHWNEDAGKTYKNIIINQELSAIENRIYEIRRKLIDEEKPVTARNIIDRFKGKKKGRKRSKEEKRETRRSRTNGYWKSLLILLRVTSLTKNAICIIK